MSDGTQIQAVLFDADGVVQQTGPDWLGALKRLCGDADRAEDFLAEVFAAERPCLLGEGDFAESLDAVLKRWNSRATTAEALRVWTMIEPDQLVFERVRALRSRGVLVALATNQQAYRADHMLDALGYAREFDSVFCSCHMGHAKPSTEYFLAALDELKLPPERVLFVDDHDANVEAAKSVGMLSSRFHLSQGARALDDLLFNFGLSTR